MIGIWVGYEWDMSGIWVGYDWDVGFNHEQSGYLWDFKLVPLCSRFIGCCGVITPMSPGLSVDISNLILDMCWYVLIFVDIRWYLLIFVDIRWYLLICVLRFLFFQINSYNYGMSLLSIDGLDGLDVWSLEWPAASAHQGDATWYNGRVNGFIWIYI